MDPSDRMVLLWPWWKPKVEEARGCEQTNATKSPPRNVPILPLDIVEIILREACKWPLRREERQVLTACTLVCKSWLLLSERLLYRSVIVETGYDNAIANASRSPGTHRPKTLLRRSHLLRFTRSLSIHASGKSPVTVLPLFSDDDPSKGCQKRVLIPEFFFLLAHTPNIQHLKLYMRFTERYRDIGEPHIHWLDWLSSLVLPIEALDIGDGDIFDPRRTFVFDLVGIWPTIRAFRLHTSRLEPDLPPERPRISLRELCLPFITHSKSAAVILEWFLLPPPPNERSCLRFLELFNIPRKHVWCCPLMDRVFPP
ncbi:hypothetical protein EI94DRAFT_760354 [Lactarius quietus]|nr:hypothetical protein EI94DRAFT_760354 [Lactarius quietus]